MHHLVIEQYQGEAVTFREDGWFNATEAAGRYGKRPVDWLRLDETRAYLSALCETLRISEPKSLIQTKRNSGTWLHPKLAVRFAQWLDMRFSVWCDMQIEALIHGSHPSQDWYRRRHEAAATYKVMGAILQLSRQAQGKACQAHHYMTEAKLVNWALVGKFQGLKRDDLTGDKLDLLAKLEELNAVLIGAGRDYEERKLALHEYAGQWRHDRIKKLAA